jgi:tRNA pseudouridine32 synthase/23S rRNA pseudouridine746 synthase
MLALNTPSIKIVFDHPDFSIIDKPVGVMMHDAQHGIITLMKQQYPSHQWYLAHRLDTATSGCLLLAKSSKSTATLSDLFAQRQIEKYYLALSDKKPKKKQGLIKGDMSKARGGSMKLMKSTENPAITQFFSHAHIPGTRAFLCKPHSGKTHQIRVALKSLGAAILGDKRYGGSTNERMQLRSIGMRFLYQNEVIEVLHWGEEDTHFHINMLPQDWQQPWHLAWPAI